MAPPYERMLKSTTYERMRAAHPAEFAPASVFFTQDARSAIDRRNSFRVKAALVYEAITGHHVDDDRILGANQLLLALAKTCRSAILASQQKETTGNGDKESGTPPDPKASTPEEKVETTDEGTEAKKDKHENEGDGHKESGTPPDPKPSTPKEEKAELTDEGWDEEHKRVVDGIFLVVGFLPRLMDAIGNSDDRDDVDESFKSRHMHDIVTDVIKLENQLPLKDLLDVTGVFEGVIKATVGREEFKEVKESITGDYKLAFTKETFGNVIHGFCWYYSPFFSKKAPDSPFKGVATDATMAARTLLDCLHQSTVPVTGRSAPETGGPSRLPAARELRRSGVRLQASENGRAEVEFKEQSTTLGLPALAYDFKLATVARNLLVREYEEQSKPVTRYFQMMNEIVEDAADVRVLRRAGVVRGGSRGAQEVYELIKNIDGHATYPSVFMAMDREIEKVRQHHDKRMKNFFVRHRPGVLWASSVAAISVVAIVAARKKRG
uniref:Uncharacterized protein n=1 Tax=Arundo donax TaxID=35708 RepID=A0A0A9GBM5_ARUDO